MSSSSSDGYFQYLAKLREELMALHASIEDACEDITFDTSKPNWQISQDLQVIIDTYLPQAAKFGVYIIEKHQNYQLPSGIEITSDLAEIVNSCLLKDMYNLNIKLDDERFTWTNIMYSWELVDSGAKCCRYPLEHNIIKEYVFLKDSDPKICEALRGILNSIKTAQSKSSDRSTRSGIREQLLLAILKINNEILPFDLEAFIKSQRQGW